MGQPYPKSPRRVRDPDALRRFRLEHLGEPCERCELRPGNQAHHKIFRSQSGDDHESNLIWLCGFCHSEMHGIREVE